MYCVTMFHTVPRRNPLQKMHFLTRSGAMSDCCPSSLGTLWNLHALPRGLRGLPASSWQWYLTLMYVNDLNFKLMELGLLGWVLCWFRNITVWRYLTNALLACQIWKTSETHPRSNQAGPTSGVHSHPDISCPCPQCSALKRRRLQETTYALNQWWTQRPNRCSRMCLRGWQLLATCRFWTMG